MGRSSYCNVAKGSPLGNILLTLMLLLLSEVSTLTALQDGEPFRLPWCFKMVMSFNWRGRKQKLMEFELFASCT